MAQQPSRAARIVGYVIAILVNLAMLWFAYQILDWGWLSFVTDDWRLMLPVITVAAAVTIVMDAGLIAYDGPVVRSLARIVQNVAALAVTVRMFQVFPFDFSPYAFPLETVVRVVLVVGIVGGVIGIVVDLVKIVRVADAREPAA